MGPGRGQSCLNLGAHFAKAPITTLAKLWSCSSQSHATLHGIWGHVVPKLGGSNVVTERMITWPGRGRLGARR
jgi:hypothetical protein